MSTDNPRGVGYLLPENFNQLEVFRQKRGLTRSEALNTILNEFFAPPPSASFPLQLTKPLPELQELEAIAKQVLQDSTVWAGWAGLPPYHAVRSALAVFINELRRRSAK